MTLDQAETVGRIDALLDDVRGDRVRSNELFHYVWTMICVRRGLLRIVRETRRAGHVQLVLEEARTGRHRLVTRPADIDPEIEALAVQALARILGDIDPVC
ncbi:MAG TPA: hypothetical protein VFB58_15010 [Chloroflexota bacterium]|nr:hypothetical protein [Chloroflexota bacterium]